MSDILISQQLPFLALRGLTVFPEMVVHFDVGREKSILAMEAAMNEEQKIFLVTQKDVFVDDPKQKDLYEIGTVAHIKQVLRLPHDSIRILVSGLQRAKICDMETDGPYLKGRIETLEIPAYRNDTPKIIALLRQSTHYFEQMMELSQKPQQEILLRLVSTTDPGIVADALGQYATFGYEEKMQILQQLHPVKRLELANRLLAKELEVLSIESDLNNRAQESINKGQKDYYLREQLKVIRTELGEEEEEDEIDEYRQKIKRLKLEEATEQKLLKEVSRLAKQPQGSSEAAVIRNYLDVCMELPWNVSTKEQLNVAAARKILDADHYGLEKVKERILESLAVRQLAPEAPAEILCLVGPPGVGKTSIAFSIARCLHRKLARIALGGVHDEAEIRGHRKTYIGAMPGRIIAGLQQAGSKNAVLLLDEIDKLGSDYRGDPSSALLEVLDSEQNATYRDHYLEVPFDLSACMFITTANTTETIPRALLDRMEVIEIGSYTDEEKLMIAKNHLLRKQLAAHGLRRTQVRVTDEALREIIRCYTREAGVRNLERQLATLARKVAMRLASQEEKKRITVNGQNLEEFLGVRRFLPDKLPPCDPVGLVTGLAWTAVGGETLEVEVNVVEGTGKLELTGNLGDVMKESAHAAMSYIRAHTAQLHIAPDFYKTKDIHVHFPEGAVPKDGPSAGITVCTAMVSALSGAPVRRDIAMTGEISIRGRVLPIGGLREKTMAALRHGIRLVIIPSANEKDLEEIDPLVRKGLTFMTAEHVDSVLEAALDFSACEETVSLSQTETARPQSAPLALPEPVSKRKPDLRQ